MIKYLIEKELNLYKSAHKKFQNVLDKLNTYNPNINFKINNNEDFKRIRPFLTNLEYFANRTLQISDVNEMKVKTHEVINVLDARITFFDINKCFSIDFIRLK